MIEELLEPLASDKFVGDSRYREGHLRVLNALPSRRVLGLHTPAMKKAAAELHRQGRAAELTEAFGRQSPETLAYEETVVWGLLINLQKCDFGKRAEMLSRYIPVMDNWAVCDTFCCNAKWMLKTDKRQLWEYLQRWYDSDREFEVRFAVISSMCSLFEEEWLDRIFAKIDSLDFDRIKSDYRTAKGRPATPQEGTVQGAAPYYVRMGVAWLLATALAKFPERTRAFVRGSHLPDDVVKLYIRKARDSFRTRTINAL